MNKEPHDLARFVKGQEAVYRRVVAELSHGKKVSHWIWFIFPQIAGLGFSALSKQYAIASRAEARAYLGDPLLGARLIECTQAVLRWKGTPIDEILGSIDAMKFRSSMTLFASVAETTPLFAEALEAFFDGERDQQTLERLARP